MPSIAVAGSGSGPADYRYVRYTGVAGKKVWIYGAWGSTLIPPPEGRADACGHAHASYGVWGRYEVPVWVLGNVSRWVFSAAVG